MTVAPPARVKMAASVWTGSTSTRAPAATGLPEVTVNQVKHLAKRDSDIFIF